MAISKVQRAKLHAMLDELIDEEDSMPGGGAFLFLREILISVDENHVERAVVMRGYIGRKSNRLRELVLQLKTHYGVM